MAHVLLNRSLRFQALYELLTGVALSERPTGTEIPDHLREDVGLPEVQQARCNHNPLGTFSNDPRRY